MTRLSPALASLLMLLAGCASLWVTPQSPPEQFTLVRPPLEVHADFALAGDDPLWNELAARRSELTGQLGLPPSNEPVYLYLFQDATEFRKFIDAGHPGFPNRRAFFVENGDRLLVYAQRSERMGDDLRHEVTHAYLHSVLPNIPLWLDEGLAKYYEVPPGRHGLNGPYVRQIAAAMEKGVWHPNLRRLEQLDPAGDLRQTDYVEAWAWVHLMLESQPATADLLRHYLGELRGQDRLQPLSQRLPAVVGQPEWALLEHVRHLDGAGK